MELRGKLAKDRYAHNKSNETHLLVELKAPKVNWEKDRAPICIVPVLDVSGSMGGEKIDYVRKACRKLVDHLSPGDFLGLVAYDTVVHPIAEPREITQEYKENLKNKIGELRAGSCTNMSGGLFQALEWVNKLDLPEKFVLRVILFTDGLANVGITGRNLLEAAEKQKGRATISAFGFGVGCDQELLADITNKCGGNYAFIDSPDTALQAFARELGGLMSTYGQNISVKITPDKNNKVVEVLNDEDVEEKDGITTIKLQDILGEESKWIVAKVQLNGVEKPLPRKVNAFEVNVSYINKDGDKEELKTMVVKVKFCKPSEEPSEEDADVVKHRDRLLAAQAQDLAEECARGGDYQGARNIMLDCSARLINDSVKHIVEEASINYSTSSNYIASRGTTNSMRQAFKKGRVMSYSKDDEETLSSAGVQCNTAMDSMVQSFTSGDDLGEVETTTGTDIKVENIVGTDIIVSTTSATDDSSTEESKTSKKKTSRDW